MKTWKKIILWLQANKLSLNVAKTEYMLIGSRQRLAKLPLEPNICIGSDPIKRVRDTKILGMYIDESLTWSKHIEEIAKTITAEISALKRLRDFESRDVLVSVYNALIMPADHAFARRERTTTIKKLTVLCEPNKSRHKL